MACRKRYLGKVAVLVGELQGDRRKVPACSVVGALQRFCHVNVKGQRNLDRGARGEPGVGVKDGRAGTWAGSDDLTTDLVPRSVVLAQADVALWNRGINLKCRSNLQGAGINRERA